MNRRDDTATDIGLFDRHGRPASTLSLSPVYCLLYITILRAQLQNTYRFELFSSSPEKREMVDSLLRARHYTKNRGRIGRDIFFS